MKDWKSKKRVRLQVQDHPTHRRENLENLWFEEKTRRIFAAQWQKSTWPSATEMNLFSVVHVANNVKIHSLICFWRQNFFVAIWRVKTKWRRARLEISKMDYVEIAFTKSFYSSWAQIISVARNARHADKKRSWKKGQPMRADWMKKSLLNNRRKVRFSHFHSIILSSVPQKPYCYAYRSVFDTKQRTKKPFLQWQTFCTAQHFELFAAQLIQFSASHCFDTGSGPKPELVNKTNPFFLVR